MVKSHPGVSLNSAITQLVDHDQIPWLQNMKIMDIEQAYHIPLKYTQPGAEGLRRVYRISYAGGQRPHQAASRMNRLAFVEYAEPKYTHDLHDLPNDAFYSGQSQFAQIRAPEAWDIIKGDSGNVVVAVVDGGTDWNHIDLINNVWTNPGEIPGNGIDDDQNGFVDDIRGWNFANNSNNPDGLDNQGWNTSHGTRVAGVVAARTNNNRGVASISWNAKVMPMNAANPAFDANLSWPYESILYAAHNGAHVITNSWGRRGGYSQLEQEIVDYVTGLGVMLLSSANNINQNNDFNPLYPANYRNVMAVGGTEQGSYQRWGNSCFGASVDVFAPANNWAVILPGGSYAGGGHNGTSFSTPLTAGLAALVLTQNPDWTGKMAAEQIRVTSDNMDAANPGFEGLLGHGRINAFRALTEFDHPAVRVTGTRIEECSDGFCFQAGDTLTLVVELTNILADVSNVTATLSSAHGDATVFENIATITSIESNESLEISFEVILDEDARTDAWIPFHLDLVNDDGYSDRDYFQQQVDGSATRSIDTGIIETSVSADGNLGWSEFRGSDGVGFIYAGSDMLNEAGLLLGASPDRVSDCIRGTEAGVQENDFRPIAGIDQDELHPMFDQQFYLVMDDLNAESPLGVIIEQEIITGASELTIFNQGLILFSHYTIRQTL